MQNKTIDPLEISEHHLQSGSLLVGMNRNGMWVVSDPLGMRGGLFSSRAEAFRFATLNHGRPRAALMVPYLIEFDFKKSSSVAMDEDCDSAPDDRTNDRADDGEDRVHPLPIP
jgi:hypothetical protein